MGRLYYLSVWTVGIGDRFAVDGISRYTTQAAVNSVLMMITEQQVTIRKATFDDATAVSALTDAAYIAYIPLIGRKPQPMTADYAQMVVGNPVWLLELDSQLVGVLVLILEPDNMLIYSVAVQPEYQKQGFGRRLLAWAEQQAIQHGYHSIRLYTNERFEWNIRLYQRLGYEETGRESFPGTTIVHMVKQLGS